MKGTPKCKGLLAAFLTVAVVIGCGLPMTGAGCVAGTSAGGTAAADTVEQAQHKKVHCAYITGYPDGRVKPLDPITREEAAVIFYRLMMVEAGGGSAADTTEESRNANVAAVQPFTDVDVDRWSNDEIATLYNAEIVQGYADGSFQPSSPVTRAEFAAMAARFDNLEITEENKFPDIDNYWAVNYINSAAEKGWVRAYGDLTFRPENAILRCEAMMWINDALNRRVNLTGLHKGAGQWPDNTEDKWYYEIVLEAATTHDYERIADRPKSTEQWTGIEENPVWE